MSYMYSELINCNVQSMELDLHAGIAVVSIVWIPLQLARYIVTHNHPYIISSCNSQACSYLCIGMVMCDNVGCWL